MGSSDIHSSRQPGTLRRSFQLQNASSVDRLLVKTHGVSAITLPVESSVYVAPAELPTTATYGWLGFYRDGERSDHLAENRLAELGIVGHKHNAFADVVNGAPRNPADIVDRFIARADDPRQLPERGDCIRARYRS
jgi:hypothetical protein